jgi:hypothetical protein
MQLWTTESILLGSSYNSSEHLTPYYLYPATPALNNWLHATWLQLHQLWTTDSMLLGSSYNSFEQLTPYYLATATTALNNWLHTTWLQLQQLWTTDSILLGSSYNSFEQLTPYYLAPATKALNNWLHTTHLAPAASTLNNRVLNNRLPVYNTQPQLQRLWIRGYIQYLAPYTALCTYSTSNSIAHVYSYRLYRLHLHQSLLRLHSNKHNKKWPHIYG